ncbi:MAG: phosphoadenylyl-sulfate reductase [Mucinivorans sp.]
MNCESKESIKHFVDQLNERFAKESAQSVLHYFIEQYSGRIGLASSLSIEDQVLTDMICAEAKVPLQCRIFTLDTGRIFPETYSLIARTGEQYGINIQVMFPDHQAVEDMVAKNGINLFYDSIEKRRECCHVRKLEPLKRAFRGLDVWICGLRHEQSLTRADMRTVEWDEGNKILKVNPLISWSEAQTWDYIRAHGVPYNTLHDKGFPSIGCQPCTRAVRAGEDIRAGRWWWENPEQKECGLHK